MELDSIVRVYLLGIGGIGMSALARYFRQTGREVAGYDRTASPLTEQLEQEGMAIHYEDEPDAIPPSFRVAEGTLAIYTPAVPKDLAELAYFQQPGFLLLKRAQVLGQITRETRCLAVAGTHGKTTTSAILAHLMKSAGMPFSAFLGGIAENYDTNFLMEGTEFSVVEADEYDRSFLQLYPDIACVTSVEADHLDIYGDGAALEQTFHEFAGRLQEGGTLFVHEDTSLKGLVYGFGPKAAYRILDAEVCDGGYRFLLQTPDRTYGPLQFSQPGRHNLLNAAVAFAMALKAGADAGKLAEGLSSFRGVARRFSYKIKQEDLVHIDDYAHHPTEIDAAREAAREMHPGKEVTVIFQPHLFSRTRDFAEGFAKSLSGFDRVYLLDIYPARELPLEGITSAWLLEQIKHPQKKVLKKSEIIDELRRVRPEVLMTLGAGDIGLEAQKIQKAFRHA